MNAPVDVLAVMDRAAGYTINADHEFAVFEYQAILEARAAVVELIEVAESFSEDASTCGMNTSRMDAAIAHVKGGAA